jgi:hypothetical protein
MKLHRWADAGSEPRAQVGARARADSGGGGPAVEAVRPHCAGRLSPSGWQAAAEREWARKKEERAWEAERAREAEEKEKRARVEWARAEEEKRADEAKRARAEEEKRADEAKRARAEEEKRADEAKRARAEEAACRKADLERLAEERSRAPPARGSSVFGSSRVRRRRSQTTRRSAVAFAITPQMVAGNLTAGLHGVTSIWSSRSKSPDLSAAALPTTRRRFLHGPRRPTVALCCPRKKPCGTTCRQSG